jgi:hypothetical protein
VNDWTAADVTHGRRPSDWFALSALGDVDGARASCEMDRNESESRLAVAYHKLGRQADGEKHRLGASVSPVRAGRDQGPIGPDRSAAKHVPPLQ